MSLDALPRPTPPLPQGGHTLEELQLEKHPARQSGKALISQCCACRRPCFTVKEGKSGKFLTQQRSDQCKSSPA